jgi:hypothetical protein
VSAKLNLSVIHTLYKWNAYHPCSEEVAVSIIVPEPKYPDQEFLWFFPVPLGKYWDIVFMLATITSFKILSNSSFVAVLEFDAV